MTEQEAVARLKARDISGLEELVRRFYTQAAQAAFLIVDDRSLAEDVAQSAFLNAYEHIGSFDSSRPFGPWFLRSVINSAIKTASGKREIWFDAQANTEIADPGAGAVEMLEAAETRGEVLAALHKLSPAQRAAVIMKYYLDVSDVEAARLLEVPAGTVRRRLHDARKKLRKLLPLDHPE